MADTTLTADGEDDLDVIEVAELPTGDKPAPKADDDDEDDKPSGDDGDDDDGEEEDARLADDADEDEAPKLKRSAKQRQIRKQAKERTLQELQFLRRQNEELMRRVSAVEGASVSTTTAQIDQRISEIQRDIRQADLILAKAIEAGNGTDAAEALRLRDEAKAAELELNRNKAVITAPRAQAPDQRVAGFADQWKRANPWDDSAGGDEDSAVVNAIDNRLAAEGYNPASPDYW